MDVIAAHTLPELLRECPEETGLAALRIRAVALARRRRRLAAKTAASARCSVLLDSLQHWVKTVAARPSLAVPPGQPMVDILVRVHTRLVSRARHLVAGTSEERHAVRIAAKRARYAADFFRSLLNERDVERYLSVLAKLQSVLGALNDFTVAEPIFVELSRGHGRMMAAAGFARGYLCAGAQRRVRKLRRWQRKIEHLRVPSALPAFTRHRQSG